MQFTKKEKTTTKQTIVYEMTVLWGDTAPLVFSLDHWSPNAFAKWSSTDAGITSIASSLTLVVLWELDVKGLTVFVEMFW